MSEHPHNGPRAAPRPTAAILAAREESARAERLARQAPRPESQPAPQGSPQSGLLVEVLINHLSGFKLGDRVVLDHMTVDQVKVLVDIGAVRPVERPTPAELKKEASHG